MPRTVRNWVLLLPGMLWAGCGSDTVQTSGTGAGGTGSSGAVTASAPGGDDGSTTGLSGTAGDGTAGGTGRTDEPDVPIVEPRPPAVSGGTLLVTADERWIIAADPDRDLIHLFDPLSEQEEFTIHVALGSEPGRVIEDGSGSAYVALRRAGQVAEIDLDSGALMTLHEPCHNPRGLGFDDSTGDVVVTCVERAVARIHPDGQISQSAVDAELRDVVSTDPLLVSLYRTPAVALLGADGSLTQLVQPEIQPLTSGGISTPVSALRTLALADGWLMLHRLATSEPLMLATGGYYGPGPCGLPTATAISQYAGTEVPQTVTFALPLIVDVAVNRDGSEIAFVGRDAEGRGRYGRLSPFAEPDNCTPPTTANSGGDPIGVAYDEHGNMWVQSREPADLYRIAPGGSWSWFPLVGESVFDTGHDLFHRPTLGGVACATCHPEGRDDGYTFEFAEGDDGPSTGLGGPRRTQALNVDLQGTEPFHWAGDQSDLPALVDEVRVNRMLGPDLTGPEKNALSSYVFALRPERPLRDADDPAAIRGAEVFTAVGCATCHSGPKLTNNQTVRIGGRSLQVPTLLGVAYRPPYMHDGRAPTLDAAVVDMLPHSDPGGPIDDQDRADLVAFLESL